MSVYFSGSHSAKFDEKHRLVLPQKFRYGLVENGELQFVLAMGMGGCLSIYRKSEMEAIVAKLRAKQHIAKFRKFLTLFFATMCVSECDQVGRFLVPQSLKEVGGFQSEVVFVGVMDRIEIWPKEKYQLDLESLMNPETSSTEFASLFEELVREGGSDD